MFKRILIGLLIVVVLAVLGLTILAYRPSIDPITPPAANAFAPARVLQGEALAGAGYCSSCHTVKGGAQYAGGYPMVTEFGTIYSTNITPDPDTGIGRWSETAFRRAMHEGVARDGSHLFPAFPYQHFNQVTDADIGALYAYFMTRPAVKAPARAPDIVFPLNLRMLQAGWKLLYFRDNAYGPVTPVAGRSAEWNRGAYLAEGLSHCSACHSPRNSLGAENTGSDRYAGAQIDGWYAPPLTSANTAPVPWNEDELYTYLRQGATVLHGVAAGPMSPVVHSGLAKLPDADVRAIAVYYADVNGVGSRAAGASAATLEKIAAAVSDASHPGADPGAALYANACGSCHYNHSAAPQLLRPELGLNSAISASDPSNLVQVILNGISVEDGLPTVMMPGYSHSLSDADVARLATWLRRSRTDQPAWSDLESRVAAIRKQSSH